MRTLRSTRPLDLEATFGPLRHGYGDPTVSLLPGRSVKTFNTPEGPATIEVARAGDAVEAEAWGPGGAWILDRLPRLIGEDDDPARLVARHRLVSEVQRRNRGHRMCGTGCVMDALLPTILGQRVTSIEAHRSYAAIVRRFGERAPGPHGLWLTPSPSVLAATPYFEFHRLGVERQRADVIRRVAERAGRMEEAAEMDPRAAERRLQAIRGVGPWTSAGVVQIVHGDPDAVIVGDYHMPNIVAWSLAGEPRGDDRRMLELLSPYKGQRARVVLYLMKSGRKAPAFGPKHRIRDLTRI